MSLNKEIVDGWVEKYGDALFNYAMSQTNDRDLSLDMLQETYISAFKGAEKFQGRSSPKTWLIGILKRKIIDHWRKQQSRKTNVVSHYFTGEDERSPGHWIDKNTPSSTIDDLTEKIAIEERVEVLEKCLELLPDRSRGVIQAKYMEQKKGAEICKDFNLTSSNLWVIVHRAKLLLRDCIQSKYIRK